MSEEIDLDALQDSIDNIDADQEVEQKEEVIENNEEVIEPTENFDLDQALDSYEPIELDGKVSAEDAEAKATERGWNKEGKDKYGHSVSAIEFLERTPMFHKMDLMRGDIKKQNEQIEKLVNQGKMIAQKSVESDKKLLSELKDAKEKLLSSELMDADDINKLRDIDKKIDEHVETPVDNSMEQRYEAAKDSFVSENEWYQTNRSMTLLADDVGIAFAKNYYDKNGVMPEPEVTFKHVLDEVKKDFPDMGRPKRQTRVASSSNRAVVNNRATKKTLSSLPDEQQAVAKMVMEAADLTEDEYLKTYEI